MVLLADEHVKDSGTPENAAERDQRDPDRFLFPRWTNLLGPVSAVAVASDEAGGLLVAFAANGVVYAQRFDGNADPVWPTVSGAPGVAVCNLECTGSFLTIAPSGGGGARVGRAVIDLVGGSLDDAMGCLASAGLADARVIVDRAPSFPAARAEHDLGSGGDARR